MYEEQMASGAYINVEIVSQAVSEGARTPCEGITAQTPHVS